MFFSDSFSLLRIPIVGVLSYVALLIVLRISGKRTLSKMNSFDFVVTVALGSVFGSILTSQDIALIDGILSFSLLIFLQFVTTWFTVRSKFFSNLIKSSPKLLYYDGHFDLIAMKKERIPKKEILQAVRSHGYDSFEDISVVILETDGSFSIIKRQNGDQSSLENVQKENEDKND